MYAVGLGSCVPARCRRSVYMVKVGCRFVDARVSVDHRCITAGLRVVGACGAACLLTADEASAAERHGQSEYSLCCALLRTSFRKR